MSTDARLEMIRSAFSVLLGCIVDCHLLSSSLLQVDEKEGVGLAEPGLGVGVEGVEAVHQRAR